LSKEVDWFQSKHDYHFHLTHTCLSMQHYE
jgi:hypothetical protein